MNVVMVAFQNIKSDGQPGVRSAEDREIVKVLDLMVNVELVQNELQPRRELARRTGASSSCFSRIVIRAPRI